MMPQWLGGVFIFILIVVVMWICSFLFSLMDAERWWEAIVSATNITAVWVGIAVVITVAATLFVCIYTESGLGS